MAGLKPELTALLSAMISFLFFLGGNRLAVKHKQENKKADGRTIPLSAPACFNFADYFCFVSIFVIGFRSTARTSPKTRVTHIAVMVWA